MSGIPRKRTNLRAAVPLTLLVVYLAILMGCESAGYDPRTYLGRETLIIGVNEEPKMHCAQDLMVCRSWGRIRSVGVIGADYLRLVIYTRTRIFLIYTRLRMSFFVW